MTLNFFDKLEARVKAVNSLLCVGLDPRVPSDIIDDEERSDYAYTFCKTIIEASAPHAAAYKPNAAFFEQLGPKYGNSTLARVVSLIPSDIPILLDAKRGDIGSTAEAYADACYQGLKADGVTLSPLMGWDSISPFVTGKYEGKGAFLLCKTSNPGSEDLLALGLGNGRTLYEEIARMTSSTWSPDKSKAPSLGLVVGATDPIALSKIRKIITPDIWILSPGVGAQGGDLDAACSAGLNPQGTGLLIPVSRGIANAEDIGAKAKEYKDNINAAREAVLSASTDSTSANTLEPYQQEFLNTCLDLGVLRFGSFILKSGRTSPYFFNAGLFASGKSLGNLGRSYANAIMSSKDLKDGDGNISFDVIFGPAYKGISLAALVGAALYAEFGVDVGYAYNRKEAKDHGEGGVLVGACMKGKRVLVVDDVITAGTAIRESHTLLTSSSIGAKPVGVVIALDRAEKRSLDDPVSAVQAVSRDLGIPVISIVGLNDLQMFLTAEGKFGDEVLQSVDQYRRDYGV